MKTWLIKWHGKKTNTGDGSIDKVAWRKYTDEGSVDEVAREINTGGCRCDEVAREISHHTDYIPKQTSH